MGTRKSTPRGKKAAPSAPRQVLKRPAASPGEVLAASEERYRAFIRNSTEGIWCYEFDAAPLDKTLPEDAQLDFILRHAHLVECNDAMARMYGYNDHTELIGKRIDATLRVDDPANIEAMRQFLRNDYQLTDIESHEKDKDGKSKYFINNLTGIVENGRLVRCWGTQRDITERRRAEQALKKQRAEYEVLFDSVHAMIWFKDAENRILRVNKTAAAMMGMRPDEIEGRSTYDLYPVEAGKYHDDDLEVIRTRRPKLGIVEALTLPTGGQRWMQSDKWPRLADDGSVIGVVVMAIDITERRRAEEAARESDERLRSIFDSASDVIFMIDCEHRYLSVNKSIRAFGVEPRDLIGKTIFDLQPPEVARRHAALHDQVIATGKPVQVETHYHNSNDPARPERWHSLTLSPVRGVDGKVAAVTGISRDITDLKLAEEERLALERKLLEARKLESMGVLAGGIAHDFNNLLAAILGNASLASMQAPLDSPLRSNLQSIEATALHAAELCKQMLSYAGKSRIDAQQHVDANAIVTEMAELLKVSVGGGTRIKLDLAADLPLIVADATQLRQVVMNLILNAAEAIGGKQGAISLSTRMETLNRRGLSGAFAAPDCTPGEYLSIEIEDTGCGMDEATRQRIFDPFFTTKFAGRGLGLAAVLGIVRGHKGAIRVKSTPSNGATFTILLPVKGSGSGES